VISTELTLIIPKMEVDIQTTFDNCNKFTTNLQDTLKSIINANVEMKSEIEVLRKDLRKV
jgi:hypothetical protein